MNICLLVTHAQQDESLRLGREAGTWSKMPQQSEDGGSLAWQSTLSGWDTAH